MLSEAPLFSDITDAPSDGRAYWLTTKDGVRIRIAAWDAPAKEGASKGTVLLFPGRTEYVEKYGCTAADLADRGYATLVIDWRGQGLADRLIEDPLTGHIGEFDDYQTDVAAMVAAAQELNLPQPWYLLGHSMGGCIGLRALHRDLPVAACAFSAPMWGIQMSEVLRPLAWSLSWGSRHVGMGHTYAPGTTREPYVLTDSFAENKLTTDKDMYDLMIKQTLAQPELGLGGPSLRWLHAALRECLELSRMRSPDMACLTFLGSDEDIIDPSRIHARMGVWPNAQLEIVDGARHEVLMETPAIRAKTIDQLDAFFSVNRPGLNANVSSATGPALRSGAVDQAMKSATP